MKFTINMPKRSDWLGTSVRLVFPHSSCAYSLNRGSTPSEHHRERAGRTQPWSWAGHINRLKDERWTSRVTTWRPYDKKRRQGRPAKRWRDDLSKYWSYTIWQRTAQDRVIWRRHAEAFAQPRDTTAAQ